jgi:DNA/RNA non-specific endonuclease
MWGAQHLLSSQFGGPGGNSFENLAPQTFLVNNSVIQQCDNRIRAALACGCVQFSITVNYPAGGDQLRPTSFTITASDMQGNVFLNGVTIDNIVMPETPSQCQRP